MTYDAIVVGGGLAGSAAAAHLARRGHAVLLLERIRFPQHRLCGEFLSGETQDLFARLGVLDDVQRAGAVSIRTATLTALSGGVFHQPLPAPALGLSRYALDPLLFHHAARLGATVREGSPVRRIERDGDGFAVSTDDETFRARHVVGAWGKRSGLDGSMQRSFVRQTTPWVGFKAHFEGDDLEDGIELHAFDGGYVGMSRVEHGRTNVCWIASKSVLAAAGGSPEAMLDGPMRRNPHLAARLGRMRRVSERFEAVAQVTFALKGTDADGVTMLGDTAGMIAPVAGDGMAMALHAAELAAPLIDGYLAGRFCRDDLHRVYAARWRQRFGLRLRLGRMLHALYVRPHTADAALRAARAVPQVGRWVMRNTRG